MFQNTLKESLNERSRLNRNIQSREIQLVIIITCMCMDCASFFIFTHNKPYRIDQLNSNPIDIEGEKLNYKNRLAEVNDQKK